MKRIISLLLCICILASLLPLSVLAANGDSNFSLTCSENEISLINQSQKVVFQLENGVYQTKTYIMCNGQWSPMFDAALPLIQGSSFGFYPDTYTVEKDDPTVKRVKFSGTQAEENYSYSIVVEMKSSSPLIHFTITSDLTSDLSISGYEPLAMLWMDTPDSSTVTVYQESPNYHSVGDSVYWNSCFPAAYIWAEGKESAIYFDMEPMDWFSFSNGVNRFKSIQIRCSERNGMTGIGMDLRRSMGAGTIIPAGDMVVDFYLYGKAKAATPTKMEALGVLVDSFGECFDAEPVKQAENFVDSGKTSYASLASTIAQQLLIEDVTYQITSFYSNRAARTEATWKDAPLFTENTITQVVRRPDYATYGAYTDDRDRTENDIYGDWNCCNNALIPWIAYERLNPDEDQHAFLNIAIDALKVYYDPDAKLIRSYECSDDYRNTYVEFMFQNPLMSIGTLKASQLRDSEEYDPALSGKYLMGLEGLMEVAHNCNYKFPQLFQAKDKMPAISLDEPHLGSPYDVWSGGLYAYNMCMAYEYTGQEMYLQEARNAIDALFEGMTLVIENDVFSAVITDPYDYPVNEVSNSAYGAAAAHWLYELTGEEKYIQYGVDMRNITLRLVNWYESNLRTDAKDQALNSAGLSHAFATADSPCPWEAIYTYLPLLMELKNEDAQTSDLLLRMLNVFRNNNKYFYGPMWDPYVFESARGYQDHKAGYLPSEDFYKAENGTLNGLNGPSVYMSNNVFYAYLMYEAFASASDADIMVVNLDFNDQPKEMLEGITRNFIVYNPTEEAKTFTLSFSHLQDSAYRLTVGGEKAVEKSAGDLEKGIRVTLPAGGYTRVSMQLADTQKVTAFNTTVQAQALLAQSYQKLQESARDLGIDDTLLGYKQQYLSALAQYTQGDYAGTSGSVNSFMDQIPARSTTGSEVDLLQDITPEAVQNAYNAALYGYVTADSGVGSLVTDGSTDTCWVSEEADGDHYVVIDLGKTVTIGAYQLVNAGGDGTTKSFQLQSSPDKVAWVLRDLVTGNKDETVFRHVAPFAARYIRVLITEPAQDERTYAQLKEVQVFQADTVEIGNLSDRSDWTVTAGSLGTDGSGITLSTSQGKAAVSHLYPAYTQGYPVLQISVSSLSDGALLQVRGAEADTPLLQISQAGVYQCAIAPDTRGDALELVLQGSGASARIDGLCLVANETNLLLNQPIRVNDADQGAAIVNGAADDTWRGTGSSSYTVDVDLGTVSLLDRYVVRYGSQIGSGTLTVSTSTDGESWTPADAQRIGAASEQESPGEETPEPAAPIDINVSTDAHITEAIHAAVTVSEDGTYIECTSGNDTSVKKTLSYDVDKYPFLEITLSGVQDDGVHLQIGQPEIFEGFLSKTGVLTADGVYRFDLSQYAEYLSGQSTFYVKFVVYGEDNSVTVSSMRALASIAASGDGFTEDFTDASAWNQTERASISMADGSATFTKLGAADFGYVARTVAYDVDQYPFLEISVASLTGGAHVHIMVNDGTSEYFISPAEITEPGVYKFPLQEQSGWSGEKEFLLKIAVIGKADGCSAEVDWIKALPVDGAYTGDDFKTVSDWNICENANISSTSTGRASITCTGSTFGYVAKSVTIDLDQTPRLKVVIPEVGDATRFHIMLNDGTKDYFLSRTEMIVPGEYNFNIKECTGWTGEKTVTLKLAVIGGAGSSYTVKELQLLPDPSASEMTTGSFTPVNARYLRLAFDDLDPNSVLDIRDVEAYGAESLADLPSATTDASSVLLSGGRYWNAALGTSSTLNFTTNDKLQVCVSEVSPGTNWNIALRSNTETAPIMVFAEPKTTAGTYTVDLNQLTGWAGIHGFEIYFTLSGGTENQIRVESLKCLTSAQPPEQVIKPHLPIIIGAIPIPTLQPALPFDDVPATAWYYDSVKSAWENGLIDGMTATAFKPEDALTVAQAIKLAAALHQLDQNGRVTLTNGAVDWYRTYVDYALANGIIETSYQNYTRAQMNAPVTRGEFVHIFYGAMDQSSYTAINTVADGKIPDVKVSDPYGGEIYAFYRAGILNGADASGAFRPQSSIKRSEVAAILSRMYTPSARLKVKLS